MKSKATPDLPCAHLDMTLREVLSYYVSRAHTRGEPCSVDTLRAAIESLAHRLAAKDEAWRAEQREWCEQLLEQASQLGTEDAGDIEDDDDDDGDEAA